MDIGSGTDRYASHPKTSWLVRMHWPNFSQLWTLEEALRRLKHLGIAIAVWAFLTAAPASSAPIASSDFEIGPDGWSLDTSRVTKTGFQMGPLEWFSANGNPNGHIASAHVGPGNFVDAWYFAAPSKFLGDQSGGYGGSLTYDLRADTSNFLGGHPEVILSNGLRSILYETPMPSTPFSYSSYSINLTEVGWRDEISGFQLTASEFTDVLSGLTDVLIRGGISTGSGNRGRLDNVVMEAAIVPIPVSNEILILALGLGVLVWHRPRRLIDGRKVSRHQFTMKAVDQPDQGFVSHCIGV